MSWLYNAPSFVSKASITKIPVFGLGLKVSRSILVDRTKHKARSGESESTVPPSEAELLRQRQIINAELGPRAHPLLVFPEGTTTNSHFLARFRKGVFLAGLPIRPVVIRYHYRRVSPAWETIGLGELFFRLMTQFHNSVEVEICDRYEPSPHERSDPALFAANVCQLYARHLDVPASASSLPEKIVLHRLLEGRCSWEEGMETLKARNAHATASEGH